MQVLILSINSSIDIQSSFVVFYAKEQIKFASSMQKIIKHKFVSPKKHTSETYRNILNKTLHPCSLRCPEIMCDGIIFPLSPSAVKLILAL